MACLKVKNTCNGSSFLLVVALQGTLLNTQQLNWKVMEARDNQVRGVQPKKTQWKLTVKKGPLTHTFQQKRGHYVHGQQNNTPMQMYICTVKQSI